MTRAYFMAGICSMFMACSSKGTTGSDPHLMFGMTVHLENHDFTNATVYNQYVSGLRNYAQIFAKHGAKLTFEPRDEFIAQVVAHDDTIFTDLQAQGHAVGSHAAVGNQTNLTQPQFVSQLTQRRTSLMRVASRVEHVSGTCSNLDFIGAIADAGFKFTTGSVVSCLLAIAPASRPSGYQSLSCQSATDSECHSPYPKALAERVHPWRTMAGGNWLEDSASGRVVVVAGGGTFPCLKEESMLKPGAGLPTCALTSDDVTLSLSDIDALIALVDPNKVNTSYQVWSYGIDLDATVLEAWLTEVDKRVAQGKLSWNTIHEMYDQYIDWEAKNR